MKTNPLASHFRKVDMYVPLPSKGKYYDSPLELSTDLELGIYPMTVRDEIEIKSADALYNGNGLFHLIESCIPSIKNAANMPICDVDPILLGIRQASYGENLDMILTCPECKNETEYSIDIPSLLTRVSDLSGVDSIEIGDVTVNIKPYTLKTQIDATKNSHNSKRVIEAMADDGISEEQKRQLYNEYIASQAVELSAMVSDSIVSITDENGTYTDKDVITEFISNIDRRKYTKISDAINNLVVGIFDKKISGTCSNCSKEIHTEIEVDPFRFFM